MIDRFLFLRLLRTQLVITLVLSSVVWLIQVFNLFDELLGSPANLLNFVTMGFLVLPRVFTFTLAPALLITVLAQLVRLLEDHEYFALAAAGLSPFRILRPMVILALCVVLIQAIISFYLAPLSSKALRYKSTELRSAVLIRSLQAGAFREILPKVTAFARARNDDGTWQQVMIHNRTSKAEAVTYVAQSGQFTSQAGKNYLIMKSGHIYTEHVDHSNSLINFEEYILPLQAENKAPPQVTLDRNHMMIHQLLNPEQHGVTRTSIVLRMKARGLEHISNLANPLVFMLVSFATITVGGLNRRGYGRRIFASVILAIGFQIGIISVAATVAENGQFEQLFIWPSLCLTIPALIILWQPNRSLFRHFSIKRFRGATPA